VAEQRYVGAWCDGTEREVGVGDASRMGGWALGRGSAGSRQVLSQVIDEVFSDSGLGCRGGGREGGLWGGATDEPLSRTRSGHATSGREQEFVEGDAGKDCLGDKTEVAGGGQVEGRGTDGPELSRDLRMTRAMRRSAKKELCDREREKKKLSDSML